MSGVDTCKTADPGVGSLIPAKFNTFVEIDHVIHDIISTAILSPSAGSIRVVVSYKRKNEHKVLDSFPGKSVVR